MKLRSEIYLIPVKLFALLSIFVGGCSNPSAEICAKMEDVARDPERVAYLRDWIEERISQEDFLKRFGLHGRVAARNEQASFLALGLDLDRLGIDLRYGFVVLHRKIEQGVDYTRKSEIVAVSIGMHRSAVVLDLREENELDQASSLEPLIGGLRFVSEGVLVSCR